MSGLNRGRATDARRGAKPGRVPKGGHRQSVRFTHDDIYQRAQNTWKILGFDSFSSLMDFTVAIALGKWKEFHFDSEQESRDYLAALGRGELIPPPHLRHDQLPLTQDCAA
uniref:hypothetical protein n=1 Tax=Streptosporangium sp. CA-235898 TaxID=3240073 RepID=UPI003F49ACCA